MALELVRTPSSLPPLASRPRLTIRMAWAGCAADSRTPLTATQRTAIILSLADADWTPTAEALPETYRVVSLWYAAQIGGGAL